MLAVLTSYFNSAKSELRLQNYKRFRNQLREENVDLFTIEVTFGDELFELQSAGEHLVQVRATDKMWQKERVLNILIEDLPPQYDEVAWMDCDLLYVRNNWPQRISKALNEHPIIQPYSWAVAMPNCKIERTNSSHITVRDCFGSGNYRRSFAHHLADEDRYLSFHKGHVGYVWAARREFLDKHKLYDPIVTGCGDLFMALGYSGHLGFLDGEPSLNKLRQSTVNHYFDWAFSVYDDTRGKVGYTDDLILHLWHGDLNSRNYLALSNCLQNYGFHPEEDLKIGNNRCWEWKRNDRRLKSAVASIISGV